MHRAIRLEPFVLALLSLRCTCESGSEREPSAPLPAFGCERPPGDALTLRASGPAAPEAPDIDAPFAIEIGRPAVSDGVLFVPFVDHDGKSGQARLLVAMPGLGKSHSLDLGALHSDAAPPQVAVAGDHLFVVVADADASGQSYRVGRLALPALPDREVAWLAELPGGMDRSPAFDVAALGDSALLVWDDWDSAEGHGFVQSAVIRADGTEPKVTRTSPAKLDAEAPRALARPNGFWLAWLALSEPVAVDDEGDGMDVVRVTQRWVQLLPLDENGAASGALVDVTQPEGYAVGFDAVSGHDAVLVAWREGRSTPGIGGGSIHTANVSPSGGIHHQSVTEDDVGAGIPSLVLDPDPQNGAPHLWLGFATADSGTRLVAMSPSGMPLELTLESSDTEESALLSARAGRLVLARPQGRDIELFTVACGASRTAPAEVGTVGSSD